jgi:SHAQKYF class myb-like DNA-binding protein
MSGEDKSTGFWTREENQLFLEIIKEYGKDWKKIALLIPTRSVNQIRSHTQKLINNICSKAKMNSTTIKKYSLDSFFSYNRKNLSLIKDEEYIFLKIFESSIPWKELKKKKPKPIFYFSKVNKTSNNFTKLKIMKIESFKILGNKPILPSNSSISLNNLKTSLLLIDDITNKLDIMTDYIKIHYTENVNN